MTTPKDGVKVPAPAGAILSPPGDGDYYSEEAADIAESKARNAGVLAGEAEPGRCHAALMGGEKCAHFCGAAQCNAGKGGTDGR